MLYDEYYPTLSSYKEPEPETIIVDEDNDLSKPKAMYRIISSSYTSTFFNEVQAFKENNPDYEMCNEPFHLKDDCHHAVFILKSSVNENNETIIKDLP